MSVSPSVPASTTSSGTRELARKHANRCPAAREIAQHLDRDRGRIRGDALRGDTVIACEQYDRRSVRLGPLRRLQRCKLDGEALQAFRASLAAW